MSRVGRRKGSGRSIAGGVVLLGVFLLALPPWSCLASGGNFPDGATNTLPELLRNLDSGNDAASCSAARALGTMLGSTAIVDDGRSVAIKALVDKAKSDRHANVRLECIRSLGVLRALDAVGMLTDTMKGGDLDMAMGAAVAIGRILGRDEARGLLLGLAANESASARTGVYCGLADLARPEDIEFLMAGIASESWRIQTYAVRGLGCATHSGAVIRPEVYGAVAELLGHETGNVAESAMVFLGDNRTVGSLNALIAVLDFHDEGSGGDATWRSKTYAAKSIRRIGMPSIVGALPALVRQLADPTANVVDAVRAILADIRKNSEYSADFLFPILLTELENAGSPDLRAAILAEMGIKVPHHLADRVAGVASAFVSESAGKGNSPEVKVRSLLLLAACERPGFACHVARCVGDDSADVSGAAVRVLARLPGPASDEERSAATEILVRIVSSPEDGHKIANAAVALSKMQAMTAVAPLVKLLGRRAEDVRGAAAASLTAYVIGGGPELTMEVKRRLRETLNADEAAWAYGTKVLGVVVDSDDIPILVEILLHGDSLAKENAANAIAFLASDVAIENDSLAGALAQCAQSSELKVQAAAIRALNAIAAHE